MACRSHNRHLPVPLLAGTFCSTACRESAPKQSPAWFETQSLREPRSAGGVRHPGTTPPADTTATRWADSNSSAHRQTHRRLTVILFAHLTAVLPSHSYRMLSLLRKPRVIHDPRHHWTVFLHGGQHLPSHLRQHLFVVPWRVRHQVMQRLVHATNIVWGQARSHRLDALAFSRQ